MDYLNFFHRAYEHGPTSGMDTIDGYLEHPTINSPLPFIKYPYPVYYNFNSRGFRGPEWPEDLNEVIFYFEEYFKKMLDGYQVDCRHYYTKPTNEVNRIQIYQSSTNISINRGCTHLK